MILFLLAAILASGRLLARPGAGECLQVKKDLAQFGVRQELSGRKKLTGMMQYEVAIKENLQMPLLKEVVAAPAPRVVCRERLTAATPAYRAICLMSTGVKALIMKAGPISFRTGPVSFRKGPLSLRSNRLPAHNRLFELKQGVN